MTTSALRAVLLPLLLFASLACNAQSRVDAADGPFSLDPYRWQNRILLVFAPSAKSPDYEAQMRLFEGEEAGFEDRDLVTIRVLDEGESRVGDRRLPEAAADQLRERFDVGADQFRVVLVGKDGTEKRRDGAPVKTSAIFEEIDAMPMRQREMRAQQQP